LEHHEIGPDPRSEDGSVKEGHPFKQWGTVVFEAAETLKKTYSTAYHTKEWMEEAGFINIVHNVHKVPIGRWPADPKLKELGMWMRAYFEDGCEGFSMALLTRILKVGFRPHRSSTASRFVSEL
jgi:hypothetical protein